MTCLAQAGGCTACGNRLHEQITVVRFSGHPCNASYDTGDGRARAEGVEVTKGYRCLHCRAVHLRSTSGAWSRVRA